MVFEMFIEKVGLLSEGMTVKVKDLLFRFCKEELDIEKLCIFLRFLNDIILEILYSKWKRV